MTRVAKVILALSLEGHVRKIGTMGDILPNEWVSVIVFATRDLLRNKPDIVRRTVKAIVLATNFVQGDQKWSMEKLKLVSGLPEEAARLVFDSFHFTRDGRISSEAVKNLQDFLVEYGIVPKEKALPVNNLFAAEFTVKGLLAPRIFQ